MIAISNSDYKEFGCPKCGCETIILDSSYKDNQPGVTCTECGLHYQILNDGLNKSSVGFKTGALDINKKPIVEYPIRVEHPRKNHLLLFDNLSKDELKDIYIDYELSKNNGIRCEYLVPYAEKYKEILKIGNLMTLSDAIDNVTELFFKEVAKRYFNKD